MEILSVTLKNFKSHTDRCFYFEPGTNAICGENGAGKTSILEAIAWTLFNYRGSYKVEDLIRNGASSAQAIVTFISNRDGRTYEVQRCTTKGYTLYDPQLDQRLSYKHIEEEVLPWLREHLGVTPGTDLARLFANTVGVPQGTFTVDFLQPPESRKKVFDAILKVEEYKQANQNMLSLEKYAKAKVDMLEQAIAQYDDTLQNLASVQQRHQELTEAIAQNETTLQQLQQILADLQIQKDQLTAQAQQVQHLEQQCQRVQIQLEGKRQANQVLEQSLERSRLAVEICATHQASHQAYLDADTQLQQFERAAKQRQTLLKQRDAKQSNAHQRQLELTKLTTQLEALTQTQQELDAIAPLLEQQVELEQQQAAVTDSLNQIQLDKRELQTLVKQLAKLNSEHQQLANEIEQLTALAPLVAQIPHLEQERDRLQDLISRRDAALQFEQDLRQLVDQGDEKRDRHQTQANTALATLQQMQTAVPGLATASLEAVRLALETGVALNDELIDALYDILETLAQQTVDHMEKKLHTLRQQLTERYQQQAQLNTLSGKQQQQQHLTQEQDTLQTRMTELKQAIAPEAQYQTQRSHLFEQLQHLGDPRSRQQRLVKELRSLAQVQQQHDRLLQTQAMFQQELAQLDQQLAAFGELDQQIEQAQQQRQQHQAGYLTVMQHQQAAEALPSLTAEMQTAIAQLHDLEQQHTHLQQLLSEAQQSYDAAQYRHVEAQYQDTQNQASRIEGSLPQQHSLLNELNHQLQTLRDIAKKRDQAVGDRKAKDKVRKLISFARKAYKEAGPRITQRYVQTISREADKLFRELMHRPNVALEWTRDYEIFVQEGAHTRRFINLSGGEQMCAALAVRLALLRVLANLDIAFFDEPTTNMDRPRRESLAEAIANIKTFRQLFVISHDDTFEKVTENVIVVEREET